MLVSKYVVKGLVIYFIFLIVNKPTNNICIITEIGTIQFSIQFYLYSAKSQQQLSHSAFHKEQV